VTTRFRQYGGHEDLEEAISLRRAALELLPTSHPDRFASLDHLANVMFLRYEQSGRHEDLEEVI